jgi:membrane-associated protease RseP (regulator of RpoE activity)
VGDVRTELLPPGCRPPGRAPAGVDIVAVGSVPAHWGEIREALLDLPAGPRGDPGSGTARWRSASRTMRRAEPHCQALEYWTDPVLGTSPPAPGARAGLQAGDRIVEVEGTPVERWGPFTRVIQEPGR